MINTSYVNSELIITLGEGFKFSDFKEFRNATLPFTKGFNLDDDVKVVINMINLSYIDSAVLGMLLVFKEEMDEFKIKISIRNVSHPIKKILNITNFEKMFIIE